jgi:hypothetical protein
LNARFIVSVTFDFIDKKSSFDITQNLSSIDNHHSHNSSTKILEDGACKTFGKLSKTLFITVFTLTISVQYHIRILISNLLFSFV